MMTIYIYIYIHTIISIYTIIVELGPQNHKKDSLSYIGSTYGPSGIYLQQNLRNFVVYTFLLIIQAPQKKLLLSALIRCPGCVQTQRPEVCAQALSPKPPKYSKPYATKARNPQLRGSSCLHPVDGWCHSGSTHPDQPEPVCAILGFLVPRGFL